MQASVLRPLDSRPVGPASAGFNRRRRRGFTLVEMLVAMALTLIMVYAIAEFYAYVGDSVRDGRAMIEMGGQLRAACQRLKRDLDSLTVRVVPWTDDGNNSGYFEYYEGPRNDKFPDGSTAVTDDTDGDDIPDINANNATNLLGDGDDILGFTITSGAEPFQGRYVAGGGVAVSRQAEVVWWTGFKDVDGDSIFDVDEPRFLFRRQLLILSNPGQISGPYASITEARNALVQYWQNNDVSASVRKSGSQYIIQANTLSDLTRREHRFAHIYRAAANAGDPEGFPGPLDLQAGTLHSQYVLTSAAGEDIVLSNLLAFDVRAYDPEAPLLADTSGALSMSPGDIGYAAAAGNTTLGYGAYVDLYYNRLEATGKTSTFSGAVATNSQLLDGYGGIGSSANYGATYDTWSLDYERRSPGNGKAMNGLDDDTTPNGVDDPTERTTSPPYAVPLRGIQVKLRIYDPSSRQVRQSTITADFVDE